MIPAAVDFLCGIEPELFGIQDESPGKQVSGVLAHCMLYLHLKLRCLAGGISDAEISTRKSTMQDKTIESIL
jgi:hypothetical protein